MKNQNRVNPGAREKLEALFRTHGYSDFKWIDPKDVVVAQWVRMKCTFGCDEYGKNCCCPPNTPSVPECERFFREYGGGVIFHFAKKVAQPQDRHKWTREVNMKLSKLEREVFLAGFERAFMLFMDSCTLCDTCQPDRVNCKHPEIARPGPEAMAVDVFSTVKKYGFPIEVKTAYDQEMNRYAFLLVE
jgi:predicted metal-binding protein